MRKALVVFVKDTAYTVAGGLAQWHYVRPDADNLEVRILGSGSLVVFLLDAENGKAQAHLGGERAHELAFFPAGGWAGYAWEFIEEQAMARASAAGKGMWTPGS